jgi:hypothetical protein
MISTSREREKFAVNVSIFIQDMELNHDFLKILSKNPSRVSLSTIALS